MTSNRILTKTNRVFKQLNQILYKPLTKTYHQNTDLINEKFKESQNHIISEISRHLDGKILDHLSQFKDTLKPATEKTHEQDTKRLNDAVVKLESRNKELTHKLEKAEH